MWREALLAKKVLKGETKGYKHHPQLIRFKSQSDPLGAITAYLESIFAEAVGREYKFDHSKIEGNVVYSRIPVSLSQLLYEWMHLMAKLQSRDPDRFRSLRKIKMPEPHPLFRIVEGAIENWERRE